MFIATINVPGYLPMDDEPPTFDTAREAWSYLAEERERAEDDLSCDGDCEDGPACQWSNAADYTETREQLALFGDETQEHGGYLVGPEGHWVAGGLAPDGTGSIVGDTPGYHGDHDLGLVYSVTRVDELTATGHDANGFPITLPHAVNFHIEESDEWICTACDEDVRGDVDDAGHKYDGDTAVQIWTAVPLEGEGDGDVFSGTFDAAFAYFNQTFMSKEN